MVFESTEESANYGRCASIVIALQTAACEAHILTTPTQVSLRSISALLLESGLVFAPFPLQTNTCTACKDSQY